MHVPGRLKSLVALQWDARCGGGRARERAQSLGSLSRVDWPTGGGAAPETGAASPASAPAAAVPAAP
eukprot:9491286-Pyramimonas_sp.AAC.1